MKSHSKHIASIGAILLISVLAAQPAMAQGSTQHSARASEHGLASAGHSIAGGMQLVSGVAAIPFGIVGSIGHVSGEIGKDLADAANAPIGQPLPISDETVSSIPTPAQAIQIKNKEVEL